MRPKKIGNSDLRSFGLIVAAGFAIIGLVPLLRGHDLRSWAVILAVVLSLTALVLPSVLRPFHRVWMTIGEGLGWVNSRIILGIVYYVLILPTGAIRRLSGKDPMRRKFDRAATTYRVARTKRPASHLQRQY
jgi:hypothetical protein